MQGNLIEYAHTRHGLADSVRQAVTFLSLYIAPFLSFKTLNGITYN